MIVYCIHDLKAETWSYPQTTSNQAVAIRDFENLAKRPDCPVADLELVMLGHFDPKSGDLTLDTKNVFLRGSDYVRS